MNRASKLLLTAGFALMLAACGRHQNTEQPLPAQAARAPAAPVPEPSPQVNEPPPAVKTDTATQRLFSGPLQAATAQPVSGVAALMKSDEGYAVRIEHLRIDGTLPELDVVLSTQSGIASANDLGSTLSLGEIKGATGNMNYPLGANIDPSKYCTVVLLLRGGNQVFATAALGLM